jgi:hypothetical protein
MSDQLAAEVDIYTTKKQAQETNIHVFSGIRTRDPSKLGTAEGRLRQHYQRYRHI